MVSNSDKWIDGEIGRLAGTLLAQLDWARGSHVRTLPKATQKEEIMSETLPVENIVSEVSRIMQVECDKKDKLFALQHDIIGDCHRCKLCKSRTNIVFGVGDPDTKLLFVGEGPGAEEDRQGLPFVGRSGQLLTKMIEAMGLSRDRVYICNVVKCRPPDNRDPEPDEVLACSTFLKAQLNIIKPTVIVTLGRYASQTLLGTSTPMSQIRGVWTTYEGVDLMPTFHPAFLLRNPTKKKEVWQDLQAAMQRLSIVADPLLQTE